MTFKRSRDLILGVVMLLVSGFYLFFALQIKTRPILTPAYAGARRIPVLLGILLAFLSVICIVQGIRKMKSAGGAKETAGEKGGVMPTLQTFAVIIAYILLMDPLGFILSTVLYLFVQMLVLAPKEKRNYLLFILTAVIFTGIVFVAFRIGFQQLLPRGVIESLLGF